MLRTAKHNSSISQLLNTTPSVSDCMIALMCHISSWEVYTIVRTSGSMVLTFSIKSIPEPSGRSRSTMHKSKCCSDSSNCVASCSVELTATLSTSGICSKHTFSPSSSMAWSSQMSMLIFGVIYIILSCFLKICCKYIRFRLFAYHYK